MLLVGLSLDFQARGHKSRRQFAHTIFQLAGPRGPVSHLVESRHWKAAEVEEALPPRRQGPTASLRLRHRTTSPQRWFRRQSVGSDSASATPPLFAPEMVPLTAGSRPGFLPGHLCGSSATVLVLTVSLGGMCASTAESMGVSERGADHLASDASTAGPGNQHFTRSSGLTARGHREGGLLDRLGRDPGHPWLAGASTSSTVWWVHFRPSTRGQ